MLFTVEGEIVNYATMTSLINNADKECKIKTEIE